MTMILVYIYAIRHDLPKMFRECECCKIVMMIILVVIQRLHSLVKFMNEFSPRPFASSLCFFCVFFSALEFVLITSYLAS